MCAVQNTPLKIEVVVGAGVEGDGETEIALQSDSTKLSPATE